MAVVTSIECVAGGAAVHVTVDDQAGNPLPPADIAWGEVAGLAITADDTGFLFAAAAGTAAGALMAQATYSGPLAPGPVVSPELIVNVIGAVTALEFSSP